LKYCQKKLDKKKSGEKNKCRRGATRPEQIAAESNSLSPLALNSENGRGGGGGESRKKRASHGE